jgi:hypothetical protein
MTSNGSPTAVWLRSAPVTRAATTIGPHGMGKDARRISPHAPASIRSGRAQGFRLSAPVTLGSRGSGQPANTPKSNTRVHQSVVSDLSRTAGIRRQRHSVGAYKASMPEHFGTLSRTIQNCARQAVITYLPDPPGSTFTVPRSCSLVRPTATMCARTAGWGHGTAGGLPASDGMS